MTVWFSSERYLHSHPHGNSEYNFIAENQYILHNTKVLTTKRMNIYLEPWRQIAEEKTKRVASSYSRKAVVWKMLKGQGTNFFNIILILQVGARITLVKLK